MRLLFISIGTVAIAFLIGLILRLWGLSLPHRQFQHPFFSASASLAIANPDSPAVLIPVFKSEHFQRVLTNSGKNLGFSAKVGNADKNSSSLPGTQILWINTYITADKKWISDYDFNLDDFLKYAKEKGIFKGKYIHSYKLEDVSNFLPSIVGLDTVINSFPNHQFILNILSNDLDVHKEVVTFVEANKIENRVLINSPIDIIIKAVKELRPMWIYGTSISEVARVKSFSTLHLEPAISVRGDVFVAPVTYLSRPLVDESLVIEMKRRKKFVFLGPLMSESEMKMAEELKPDAIIY